MEDLKNLWNQLDQSKFVRLWKFFVVAECGLDTVEMDYQPSKMPFEIDVDYLDPNPLIIPIDIAECEFWYNGLLKMNSVMDPDWAYVHRLFQIEYISPAFVDDTSCFQLFSLTMENTLNKIRANSLLVKYLQGGFPREFHYVYRYYFLTNMDHEFLATEEANEMGREVIRKCIGTYPPHFDIGAYSSMIHAAQAMGFENLLKEQLIELLHTPSELCFIMGEEKIVVGYYTDHGLYLAGPTSSVPIGKTEVGTLTAISSVLPIEDNEISEVVKGLQSIINSPRIEKEDIRKFLHQRGKKLLSLFKDRFLNVDLCVFLTGESLDKNGIPKFIARIYDSDVWSVSEIEISHTFGRVNKRDEGLVFSAITKGILELRKWCDRFNRQKILSNYQIDGYTPYLGLIVRPGTPLSSIFQYQSIRLQFPQLTICSYKDLISKAMEARKEMSDVRRSKKEGER